jgi:uncharacterized membrane protein YfcA
MWFAPLLLLLGGFTAGVVNSVAGGGSLVVYPVLISIGVPPIIANASTSLAVLPGLLSSAFGYRTFIRKLPLRYYVVLIPAVLGGLVGASLLRTTTNQAFSQIVPCFLLFGVILIILQPRIISWAKKKRGHHRRNALHTLAWLATGIFLISIYGGYFGAGYAIVALAFLGLTELTNINEMNGYKGLLSAAVNISSSAYLICFGLVQWSILPWLVIGSVVGGYVGATYSSQLPRQTIRRIIIVIGLGVSIVLYLHR